MYTHLLKIEEISFAWKGRGRYMYKKTIAILLCGSMLACGIAGCGTSGGSSNYPNETVNVIVPYTAGGGTDLMVRTITANIDLGGQTMIVTNIEGANALTGSYECYNAEPDGYTLLSIAPESWAGQYLSGALEEDLCSVMTPLCVIAEDANIIAVAADSEWQTFDDLVNYAKEKGKDFTIASTSAGGSNEAFAYGLAEIAGFEFTYVPYDGASKSRTAVLGGQNDAVICQVSEIKALADSGDMRVLGVASAERPESIDAPTFIEQGYDIEFGLHRSMFAPPGVDEEIISYLETQIQQACESEEVQSQLLELGYEPAFTPGDELAAISDGIKATLEHWSTLISA